MDYLNSLKEIKGYSSFTEIKSEVFEDENSKGIEVTNCCTFECNCLHLNKNNGNNDISSPSFIYENTEESLFINDIKNSIIDVIYSYAKIDKHTVEEFYKSLDEFDQLLTISNLEKIKNKLHLSKDEFLNISIILFIKLTFDEFTDLDSLISENKFIKGKEESKEFEYLGCLTV